MFHSSVWLLWLHTFHQESKEYPLPLIIESRSRLDNHQSLIWVKNVFRKGKKKKARDATSPLTQARILMTEVFEFLANLECMLPNVKHWC